MRIFIEELMKRLLAAGKVVVLENCGYEREVGRYPNIFDFLVFKQFVKDGTCQLVRGNMCMDGAGDADGSKQSRYKKAFILLVPTCSVSWRKLEKMCNTADGHAHVRIGGKDPVTKTDRSTSSGVCTEEFCKELLAAVSTYISLHWSRHETRSIMLDTWSVCEMLSYLTGATDPRRLKADDGIRMHPGLNSSEARKAFNDGNQWVLEKARTSPDAALCVKNLLLSIEKYCKALSESIGDMPTAVPALGLSQEPWTVTRIARDGSAQKSLSNTRARRRMSQSTGVGKRRIDLLEPGELVRQQVSSLSTEWWLNHARQKSSALPIYGTSVITEGVKAALSSYHQDHKPFIMTIPDGWFSRLGEAVTPWVPWQEESRVKRWTITQGVALMKGRSRHF